VLTKLEYFNAFYEGDGKVFIESDALVYEKVFENITDSCFEYAYTLVVGDDYANKVDYKKEAKAFRSNGDYYEKLTAHELQLIPGRV